MGVVVGVGVYTLVRERGEMSWHERRLRSASVAREHAR